MVPGFRHRLEIPPFGSRVPIPTSATPSLEAQLDELREDGATTLRPDAGVTHASGGLRAGDDLLSASSAGVLRSLSVLSGDRVDKAPPH
jgi:hypothetical protein